MGDTGECEDVSVAKPPAQDSSEVELSGEETVNLISRLLDRKLDQIFAEFKRGFKQKELCTTSQIKKLKTEAKARR